MTKNRKRWKMEEGGRRGWAVGGRGGGAVVRAVKAKGKEGKGRRVEQHSEEMQGSLHVFLCCNIRPATTAAQNQGRLAICCSCWCQILSLIYIFCIHLSQFFLFYFSRIRFCVHWLLLQLVCGLIVNDLDGKNGRCFFFYFHLLLNLVNLRFKFLNHFKLSSN